MLELDRAAVIVVAAETQTAVDVLDSAYVAHLKMSAEAVDGLRNSGSPISHTRRLMKQLFEGQVAALAWRKHTEDAISTLQVIHRKSNQAEVDVGCAAPWDLAFFTTATAKQVADAEPSAPVSA